MDVLELSSGMSSRVSACEQNQNVAPVSTPWCSLVVSARLSTYVVVSLLVYAHLAGIPHASSISKTCMRPDYKQGGSTRWGVPLAVPQCGVVSGAYKELHCAFLRGFLLAGAQFHASKRSDQHVCLSVPCGGTSP